MIKHGVDANCRQRYRCAWCGATKGGHPRVLPIPGLIRKPKKFDAAALLFRQGFSYRHVMRTVGITNATASKYRKLALAGHSILCACGQSAGHKGWCEWRVSQSSARQAYYAKCAAQSAISLARVRPRVEPLLTTWPYVRKFDSDDYDLLQRVNAFVPRNLPEHVRADVAQDVLLDILSGQLELDAVNTRMKDYVRRGYQFVPSKFGPISIDAPLNANGFTLADVLEG